MPLLSKIFFTVALFLFTTGWPGPLYAKSPAPENCAARPFDQGRLWKVSKEDIPPSHIFGTMHSKDPRILHLPGVVMQAFTGAGTAIFETSLKDNDIARSRALMLLPAGDSLRNRLGDARFGRLLGIAERYGLTADTLNRFKIWAAAAVISQPPPDPATGQSITLLDKELEKSALQTGKRVLALESNDEQLAIFDAMPETVQIEYLDQAISENPRLNEELETLTSHYLAGRTGWIACDLEETLKTASPDLDRVMTEELIDKRNRRMVERMLPELKNGNAFVGIGALHLPGAEGVLFLLRKHGFSIERKY